MGKDAGQKGWWHTAPGILTATAGIITAVTGLIVALHQVGVLGQDGSSSGQEQTYQEPEVTKAGPTSEPPDGDREHQAASQAVELPPRAVVRLQELVYEVLAARLDSYASNQATLHFDVRLTNNGPYPVNFWAASFRLKIDGILRPPENDLNEVVDGHSAKEGFVEFSIPADADRVELQMGEVGAGASGIPMSLAPGS